MTKTFTTLDIANALNGRLIGSGDIRIARVAHPADVRDASDLAMAVDPSLLPLLVNSAARAAVVSNDAEIKPGLIDACIVVDRPRLAMAKITNLFNEPVAVVRGIHPTAVVEPTAQIGENVSIGAQSYVSADAKIGANSVLHPQTYVGPNAVIGRDALIYAGVKIGAHIIIGNNCIIHFNASIGSDGFSFVTPQPGSVEEAKGGGTDLISSSSANRELVRIASLGTIIIGDDVEIGSNTSIDRGTIAATRIGNGTKIDNQVQIGHNVVIGENCLICGRVGIAGSATVGNRVVIGGAAGIADHVMVGDDAVIMAMSGLGGNVPARTVVGGFPAMPRERLMRNMFHIGRLKQFYRKVDELVERLAVVEKRGNQTPKE